MADDEGTAEHEGTDHQRIVTVEHKIDQLTEMVGKILPGSHAEAEERTEARLDRGTAVEEQVRAELARAREEEAAEQRKQGEAADKEDVRARLARLEEKPPAPPRSRRTALLGWGDGR